MSRGVRIILGRVREQPKTTRQELVNDLKATGASIIKKTVGNTLLLNRLKNVNMTQRTPSPQSSMEVETCLRAVFLQTVQGDFTTLRGPMNQAIYCKILDENLLCSARTLKVGCGVVVFQSGSTRSILRSWTGLISLQTSTQ